MHKPDNAADSSLRFLLPWLVALVALLAYALTMDRWLSIASAPVVSRVSGWDWTPSLQFPLLHVVTLPFRLLPAGWQPGALNLFTAVCAAGALGLLARAIMLIPQDRTGDQRQREQSEFSLLSGPLAWVPPVFAAGLCGLQLTFWEHATALTGEMLDLLVFAYCVRSVLEFRLDPRESWLTRMAFVYGLGVTNNFAMIGFFPAFVAALVWIRGRAFFNASFVLRMVGCGAAGLLLYLALPLATKLTTDLPYTFWQLLKTNLGYQWTILKAFPKYLVLILGLTGLLPVLAMGVRWPSTFGETSAAGVMLTGLMFRVVHGFFLAACVWVAFDPEFSPRKLGLGLPFLTFYWLGALSAGYYLGYFLVVCGKTIDRRWNRPRWWERMANRTLLAAALAVAVAAPVALAWRNFPVIRAANGPELARFIGAKVAALPAHGAIVLSDDPVNLTLVEAALRREGRLQEFLLLHTRFLPLRTYHEHLRQAHPDRWPNLFAAHPKAEGLDSPALMQLLRGLAESNSVYYLHPSFGYYFENFYPEPRGLIYRLQPYPPNSTVPPALPDTIMDFNARFWERLAPQLTDLERHVARGNPNSILLGRNYAIAANFWGVQLQRARRLEEARQMFDLAIRLNPDNVSALINAQFNASLRRGAPARVAIGKTVEDKFGKFRTWDAVLGANGPIDEPDFCFRLGLLFARNLQFRQSANNLLRARELDPDNPEVHLWLANTYLQGRRPDTTLAVLEEFRARTKPATLGMTNQIELARLEAWAHFYLGDTNASERVWREARAKFPQSEAVLDGLAGFYMLTGRFTQAQPLFTELLNLAPENPRALLNLAAIHIQMKNFEPALELLDRLLVVRPGDRDALLNRAIARLQSGRLAEAQADYQAILTGNPTLFTVHYGLGEIAWRQTNHPAALSNYLAYLKYAPTNTDEARNVRARVQELKEKLGIK